MRQPIFESTDGFFSYFPRMGHLVAQEDDLDCFPCRIQPAQLLELLDKLMDNNQYQQLIF